MKISEVLLLDFDKEMDKTRTSFEAIPEDSAGWKPHEKSGSLGQVAKHVALLPYFGALFLESDHMDVGAVLPPTPAYVNKADLFRTLDESSTKLRGLLAPANDDFLLQRWEFRKGGTVLDGASRASMVKVMFLHHFIHHRAQLGVYLRLLDVPVPGLYGPSADEAWKPGRPGVE